MKKMISPMNQEARLRVCSGQLPLRCLINYTADYKLK